MSDSVRQAVLERSTLKGAALAFLTAAADQADDDGYTWVGDPKLAARARITDRHLRRIRQAAVAAGELAFLPARGRGRHHLYRVLIGQPDGAGTREALEAYVLARLDAYGHLLPRLQETGHPVREGETPRSENRTSCPPAGPDAAPDRAIPTEKADILSAPPTPPHKEKVLSDTSLPSVGMDAQDGGDRTVVPMPTRSPLAMSALQGLQDDLAAELAAGHRSWDLNGMAQKRWVELLDLLGLNLGPAQQFLGWYVATLTSRPLAQHDWMRAALLLRSWRAFAMKGVAEALAHGRYPTDDREESDRFWNYAAAVCKGEMRRAQREGA